MATTTAGHPAFEQIKKKYGFLPNILRDMGTASPAVLNAYLAASEAMGKSSLSPQETNAIFLTVSELNGCGYCTSAHGTVLKGTGMNEEDISAVKKGKLPDDDRLRVLGIEEMSSSSSSSPSSVSSSSWSSESLSSSSSQSMSTSSSSSSRN